VVEAEFEGGVWEIEFVMAGEEHEICIDPMTGESVDAEVEETDSN